MSRHVLVPVDGSPKSMAGLEYAVTTYDDRDITVLHVVSPNEAWEDVDEPAESGEHPDWYDEARADAEEILAAAREMAADHDTDVSTAIEVGEPWRVIVEYAEEQDVDHIIMGSHGRDEDSPVPLGSVAEAVMRRATVFTSIVR